MMSSSISTIAAAARRAVAALRRSTGAAARAVSEKAVPLAAHAADVIATRVAPVIVQTARAVRAAPTVLQSVQTAAVAAAGQVRSFFAVRTFSSAMRRAGGVAAAAAAAVGLAYASSTSGVLVEEARPIADAIPPLPAVSRAPVPDRAPKPLGRFRMTFYYVVNEEDVPEPPVVVAAVDAATATETGTATGAEVVADVGDGGVTLASTSTSLPVATGPELVPVFDKRCKELAQVTPRFLAQMRMQGTGKLRDGRTLNIWGDCECPRTPCYREVEGVRWGYAGNGRALSPFRTVAVDPRKIKLGSLLYVAELDGRTMPGRAPWGGFVHDGCVVADDTGGGVKGHQLDLFVGRRAYYKGLGRRGGSHAWARKVAVYDGSTRCQRTGGKVSASQRGAI